MSEVICPICRSEKIDYETIEVVAHYPSEVRASCEECGHELGYWAHGDWDPHSDPRLSNFKTVELIGKLI